MRKAYLNYNQPPTAALYLTRKIKSHDIILLFPDEIKAKKKQSKQ
jgi:hypothetical protein